MRAHTHDPCDCSCEAAQLLGGRRHADCFGDNITVTVCYGFCAALDCGSITCAAGTGNADGSTVHDTGSLPRTRFEIQVRELMGIAGTGTCFILQMRLQDCKCEKYHPLVGFVHFGEPDLIRCRSCCTDHTVCTCSALIILTTASVSSQFYQRFHALTAVRSGAAVGRISRCRSTIPACSDVTSLWQQTQTYLICSRARVPLFPHQGPPGSSRRGHYGRPGSWAVASKWTTL